MALIVPLLAYMAIQGPASGNWNPKLIDFSKDFDRVRFKTYLPSKKLGFQLAETRLVWVPKTSRYPEFPARQAIRFTLHTPANETIELVEAPGSSDSCGSNMLQVVGDGYLGFSWLDKPNDPAWKSKFTSMPGTCVSVSSTELSMNVERLEAIINELKRVRRNEHLKKLVWD